MMVLVLKIMCAPTVSCHMSNSLQHNRLFKPSQIVVDSTTLYRYERTAEGALLAFDNVTIEQGTTSASSATADVTGDWVVSLVVLLLSADQGITRRLWLLACYLCHLKRSCEMPGTRVVQDSKASHGIYNTATVLFVIKNLDGRIRACVCTSTREDSFRDAHRPCVSKTCQKSHR